VNFSILGFGDIVMSDEYRLLGPIQAINGVLMIGVTTAVLMAAYQDAMKKTRRARQEPVWRIGRCLPQRLFSGEPGAHPLWQ
jgi:hypothetical protein